MKILSKLFSVVVLGVLSLTLVTGCKDDDEVDDNTNPGTPVTEKGMTFTSAGQLTVYFNHKFKDVDLQLSPEQYVTDANDTIVVTELNYYITNIILTTKQGTQVHLGNANLIQFVPPAVPHITLNIPAGTYTSISYLIGVDSTRNCSGTQEGDLDPGHGMFWSWNTGYVFVRAKGRFSSAETSYSLDIGGTSNIMSASHSITNYTKSGTSAVMYVKMDMAKMFNTPNVYDLKSDSIAIHNATSPAIQKLRPNISGAFSVTGIE